ncbi:sugar ABC transporter ATP-binding protein [Acidisoma silvae]|uniref:Sugar ABC transporter ATP-binding protein n=1 Tax=Acidisoma silvae TaxID=2802396 RepID=A0A963YUT9_9PROT|nr:sugar ABC transporter ATP-binding protein [Acidisoma silvae]MCB8877149.1 sugar ABC transporter ATP-binding protein [Acidisoma silvae]
MLSVSGIRKAFPGVQALAGVDLEVRAGEIHALVGENGAGKSTLTRIIAGVERPDAGEIRLNQEVVQWHGPAQAKAAGIHVIYQEFVLFPHLTVAENIFLGRMPHNRLGFIDHAQAERRSREILSRLGITMDVRRQVRLLSVADQQMVEIAKALVETPKVLILDEPTAVIAGREVDLLFDRLRRLQEAGVAIIYISHRLDEIFALCDRLTVIKDGQWIATRPVAGMTRDTLITLMVGRDLAHLFPAHERPPPAQPEIVLQAQDIHVGSRVRGCSLDLRAGVITGLAGMVGSGRSELAMAIFGGLPMERGAVTVGGHTFRRITPGQAIALGIGFVTEDRKGQGLAMLQTVGANISAANLDSVRRGIMRDGAREWQIAEEDIGSYQIACRGPGTLVSTMSGGNQQKVLIARWARACHRVLILDEPTRGVDVGARAEIYRIMRGLAARGIAILMISSELPEIVGMSDRVYVMREGSITGFLEKDAITEEAVVDLATHDRQAA